MHRQAAAIALLAALACAACDRADSHASASTVRQLAIALREGDTATRISAASELRTFGRAAADAIPALSGALASDPSALVRMSAAAALGAAGPQAIPALARGLSDGDEQVRAAVVGALGAIREPDEALLNAVAIALRDNSEIVRSRAVWAAERVGPEAAHLVRAAAGDSSSLVRSRADMAMRSLDDAANGRQHTPASRVLALAADLNASSKGRRRQAAQDLAAIGRDAEPALSALQRALADPDRHVRLSVVAALTNIGFPALPALQNATRDPDSGVRARAASGIGRFGTSGAVAIPTLANLLRDEEIPVRLAAVGALERIGVEARETIRIATFDDARIVRDRAERALQNVARNAAARAASH